MELGCGKQHMSDTACRTVEMMQQGFFFIDFGAKVGHYRYRRRRVNLYSTGLPVIRVL